MNKYGFFSFFDYPINTTTSQWVEVYQNQYHTSSFSILWRTETNAYEDFASFEKGEFDFTKPLFKDEEYGDPESTQKSISYASEALSDENGVFSSAQKIILEPNESISGSGFSLRLFNGYYKVTFKVVDIHGTRSFEFDKTDDEFYPIPNGYESLTRVEVSFDEVEPYHFIRLFGFSYGAIRKLQDTDFVEEPEIVNHYSMTGEELEYDTLDLCIRGDKTNFNIQQGEKLIYSETQQVFYVESATQNRDGTISISCYDDIARLDKEFRGVFSQGDKKVKTWLRNVLKGGFNDITVNFSDDLIVGNDPYFKGKISSTSFRDAAQIFLQGTRSTLKRLGNSTYYVCRPLVGSIEWAFRQENLVTVPDIEVMPKINRYEFTKHYYEKNKTNGKQYAYYATVQNSDEVQSLLFDAPYANTDIYYVSGYVDDEPTLVDATTLPGFSVVTAGFMYYEVINDTNQPYEIVIMGYPYEESQELLTSVDDNAPITYKENVVEINDCTIFPENVPNSAMMSEIMRVYRFNYIRITFDSILNADAGGFASLYYQDTSGMRAFQGHITQKVNRLNGVYSYELRGREVTR